MELPMNLKDLPADVCKLRTVEAGDIIFLEGQPAENAYVILKGHADVVVQGKGDDLIPLARMHPGELFGEVALLTSRKARTATVMAADRCELLEINRDIFDARLAKTDPLVRFVLDHVTRRLVQLTDKVVGDHGSS
jgi:CRP/FNR family cyclic AMP-dependent transcriptional regulator